MASRHATTLTYGRHLVRVCHHECHRIRTSLSMVKQMRGFSDFRRLSLPPTQSPHQASPSPAAALAPLDVERLRAEMLARPEQLTYDALSNVPSYLFDISLSEYLDGDKSINKTRSYNYQHQPQNPNHHPFPIYDVLQQGHHLIHFPPALPPSRLCPDGTDPYHSPGLPFERRMWAGGSIEFPSILRQNLMPAVCAERIQDVKVRGPPGDEKVFVEVLRRYGQARKQRGARKRGPFELYDEAVREVRTLVFMRKQEEESSGSSPGAKSEKLIKGEYLPPPPHHPLPLFPSSYINVTNANKKLTQPPSPLPPHPQALPHPGPHPPLPLQRPLLQRPPDPPGRALLPGGRGPPGPAGPRPPVPEPDARGPAPQLPPGPPAVPVRGRRGAPRGHGPAHRLPQPSTPVRGPEDDGVRQEPAQEEVARRGRRAAKARCLDREPARWTLCQGYCSRHRGRRVQDGKISSEFGKENDQRGVHSNEKRANQSHITSHVITITSRFSRRWKWGEKVKFVCLHGILLRYAMLFAPQRTLPCCLCLACRLPACQYVIEISLTESVG